jgi:hypothetical protein
MGADQTKPTGVVLNQAEPTPDPSRSSVASTAQLNQLLTQLNSLLQQQTAGFVLYNSNLSSFKNNSSSPKLANLGHNTSKWVIDSGATDHMT